MHYFQSDSLLWLIGKYLAAGATRSHPYAGLWLQLFGVLELTECYSVSFSLCHEQLYLEKLLPEFTVQTLLGQKSHLTCELLDLLCPRTGWRHFLQCGGSLVVVSLVLEALGSLWLWLEIGNGCEDRLRLAIS